MRRSTSTRECFAQSEAHPLFPSASLLNARRLKSLSGYAFPVLCTALNTGLAVLFVCAFALMQALVGGTRLLFSLPSYAVLALAAIASATQLRRAEGSPRIACLAVTVVFFAYILGRAATSPVPYLAWMDLYMVLGCLAAYFTTVFSFAGDRQRNIVVAALLAFAVVQIFFALRQFSGGDNWMPFGFLRADYGRRASGSYISSIHLAGYLEVVAVFGLSYAFWSKWRGWARGLAGYIAVLCYLGVAITGSRGGYISAAVALVAFVILSLYTIRIVKPERFWRATAIAVAASVVFAATALVLMNRSEMLKRRLSLLSSQLEKNGLDIRVHNWAAALDHFSVNPIIGTGAGTHVYYGRLFRRAPLQADPIHAHSDYLELIAEYGVVGGVGMLAFLVVHLRGAVRAFRRLVWERIRASGAYAARDNTFALHMAILCAIAAYLAHSVIDFNLHIPVNALMFAFIFGVVANPGLPPEPREHPTWFHWSFAGVMVLIAAAIIITGLPKFPGEYWAEKTRLALQQRRLNDAIALGKHALTYERRNPELYFYIGGAYRGLGLLTPGFFAKRPSLEAAVGAYTKALELFPEDEHVWVRLGETLDDLGRFKEAERAFRRAVELDPNLGVLRAYLANHLALVGRDSEAAAEIQEAIRLDANSTRILNSAARAMVNQPQ